MYAAALTLGQWASIFTIVAAVLTLGAFLAALFTVGRAADASRSAEVTVRLSVLDRLAAVHRALRALQSRQRGGVVIAGEHAKELRGALEVVSGG